MVGSRRLVAAPVHRRPMGDSKMTSSNDPKNHDVLVSPRGLAGALRAALKNPATPLEGAASGTPAGDAALEREIGEGLEQALALLEAEPERGAVMFAPDHRPTSLLQSFLSETASGNIDDLRRGGKLDLAPDGGYEAKFDTHDITGWALSLLSWWKRLKKHPFLGPPETPDRTIPNRARVAVLGDWGSGRYGAPVSAATIQATRPAYDLLLHLGDVYYSGTPKEVQERFLDCWPKVPGALSRAVNSNHEMYSGGEGFFEKTLPAFGQASSCFAVQNDHFLLIGLDTGYEEHDLTKHQVPWIDRLVAGADAKRQKVVLFSHHQLFSALEKQGTKLEAKLSHLLEKKRIFAWYWGHEHRAVIYDRHPRWGLFGRLIGHSGFPYFRDKVADRPLVKTNDDGSEWRRLVHGKTPDALILDGPNPYVRDDPRSYGPNGHLSLELNGGAITETVHAPDGTVLFTQTIE